MPEMTSIIRQLRKLRAEMADRLERIRRDRHHVEGPVSANFKEQAVERANDDVLVNLEQATEADLRQMDHALQRVEAGLYPRCEVCGSRIDMERLKAMPFATVCAECVNEKEAARTRPAKRAIA